jgi:large subunit ribosomal protein L13
MSTYLSKTGELKPEWHVVDATGLILGRLAARIALVLQGKHKPTYTPHVDTGDYVIVLNADKVRVTGRKAESITYQTYTEWPSGQKIWTYKDMIARKPEKVLEVTVRRMLPKSRLGRKFLAKLKVYRGTEHPHQAQQPKELKFS